MGVELAQSYGDLLARAIPHILQNVIDSYVKLTIKVLSAP